MVSIEWAKPVATELLVIRMSQPFAAKPAAIWVMKRWFYMALIKCIHVFQLYFGPHQYTVEYILMTSSSVATGLAHSILII